MNVLIADDSSFMVKVLQNVLEPMDFEQIYTASDGGEAVEKYEEHKPGLVLLDIVMDNMDGISALKQIKKIDDSATVLMISAVGQEDTIDEAMDEGAEDFITKPFDNDDVRDTIEDVIG
jgi:two-component system chemotaxis response regulator CheY